MHVSKGIGPMLIPPAEIVRDVLAHALAASALTDPSYSVRIAHAKVIATQLEKLVRSILAEARPERGTT
jgi:hypothetical protein